VTDERFEEIMTAADPKPKRAAGSSTQRSKKYLEGQGYLVAVVEKWNPHARIRQDLFQIIDLLAIKEGETLGVQTTSRSNMSSRARKIAEHENTPMVRKAGWAIHVHGWAKDTKGRWGVKVQDVS
jgi:hypothetical protein